MKTTKLNQIIFKCIAALLISASTYAQVGVGTITPDASSMMDVSSTNKGMLAPRMTTAQRVAIASPANGLLVYDTTENAFYFYIFGWIKTSPYL